MYDFVVVGWCASVEHLQLLEQGQGLVLCSLATDVYTLTVKLHPAHARLYSARTLTRKHPFFVCSVSQHTWLIVQHDTAPHNPAVQAHELQEPTWHTPCRLYSAPKPSRLIKARYMPPGER